MSEFRRRLMMANVSQGGDNGDYIKDGLVFHLDGINKGSDSTAWTDLIKGIKFTYSNCILNSDNVEFDGYYSECKNSTDVDAIKGFGKGHFTLEVVLDNKRDTKSATIIYANYEQTRGVGLVLWDDKSYTTPSISFFPKKNIGKMTTSLTYPSNGFIQNKDDSRVRTDNGSLIPPDEIIIGRDSNGYKEFLGKIYSIRIYTRELSKEEVLHNQQVDIDRFFGGVIPQ